MSTFLFLNYNDFTVRQEPGIGEEDRQAVLDGRLDVLRFNGSLWQFERLTVTPPATQLQETWEKI